MTTPNTECPIDILSAKLLSITELDAMKHSLDIGSASGTYNLVIARPRLVQEPMTDLSTSDVQSLFDEQCRLLKVFTGRCTIEFWGAREFLGRTIKGTELQVKEPTG